MPTSFSDRKGGCATGFAFLAVLAGVSLGITIRLYIDRNKERPEELAQCIVMGIFVPTFIVVSAYLNVVELTTPEWHVRLVLATNSLFAIATGAFAILDGVFQILGTSPPRTTLDTVSLVLNAAQA
ncbi:uncharacterized protein CTRU02_211198 [Colletotrichum truncatum]|uniref:Uncharacterized protein n=1 Tax=Colletotrichum truncatum TaxID=5467 RepID=A0ACC3YR38_COLTU